MAASAFAISQNTLFLSSLSIMDPVARSAASMSRTARSRSVAASSFAILGEHVGL